MQKMQRALQCCQLHWFIPGWSISKPAPCSWPQKMVEDGPSIWATNTHMRNTDKHPGFSLSCCDHLGNELANGTSVCQNE